MKSIRTDLALEAREVLQEQNQFHIPGVRVDEEEKDGVKISWFISYHLWVKKSWENHKAII